MHPKNHPPSKGYHEKKAAVLNRPKHNYRWIMALLLCCVASVTGLTIYFINPHQPKEPTVAPYQMAAVAKPPLETKYPVAMFADGKARHFQHQADGRNIRFFILQSTDGVIRAAFDACDVCWPEGQGYVQSGAEMVCRFCQRRFASELINIVTGGCNPAPLNHVIDDGQVVIKVEDILSGAQYFNFKQRS